MRVLPMQGGWQHQFDRCRRKVGNAGVRHGRDRVKKLMFVVAAIVAVVGKRADAAVDSPAQICERERTAHICAVADYERRLDMSAFGPGGKLRWVLRPSAYDRLPLPS